MKNSNAYIFSGPHASVLSTPPPKPNLSTVQPPVIIEDDQVNFISPSTAPSTSTNAAAADASLPPLPPIAPAQPLDAPSARMHPMRTRAQNGIVKSKYSLSSDFLTYSAFLSSVHSFNNPKGFKSAAKSPEWIRAMNDELNALRVNHTWDLVPRPLADNVIGSKWVFRTKFLGDGSIERHKARLVAQGFAQLPGFDYDHTFSPVVKASTIRIVLSIAVLNNWSLHQLDVNNAFLHGRLDKPVFMEQPPGFTDPIHPSYVCRLNKAIHGLKQAPRAWFKRFSDFILNLGFIESKSDTSLFIYHSGHTLLYLLVYVDDIIITGSDSSFITRPISRIRKEFAIKDLGNLNYFLGLEVTYTRDGIFLGQSKYARDILVWANMLDSKPISTPLAPDMLLRAQGDPYSDPTLYRSLVGALQYLTITRPDLSFAVNTVSQFQANPTFDHFQAVKRILRYVKGTLEFGLDFSRGPASILGYSDADWARCLDTRRSTYGYSIFLGPNLVSWSAKKQPTVSRSSCESEYRAMANAASEIILVTLLLRELHALPNDVPILLSDNKSALFLSQNPIAHKRAKHIDIDYHFVRELVSSKRLHTKSVPSHLQLADIFTKGLSRPLFEFFRSKLRVISNPLRLMGGVRN